MVSFRPFRIAVLISGGGTTLRNLIEKTGAGQLPVEIALVVSSSPDARGLEFARAAGVPSVVIERKAFATQDDSQPRSSTTAAAHHIDPDRNGRLSSESRSRTISLTAS